MTANRDAIVLPLVFLTVVLLGGIEIGPTGVVLRPPSVFALILGVLLLQLLIQSAAVDPQRLLSSSRSPLANANGVVVFASLWAASAQIFASLIPASGLPRLAFNVFFAILLLNTAATAPDRRRLLRSLAVTFGAAFVLKFVVLQEVSAPGESGIKRVLQALLDTVTLGVLVQTVLHPVTGYLALFTIVLFLIGLVLLPGTEYEPHAGALVAVAGDDVQTHPARKAGEHISHR
jgi:hypothetical protein